MSLKQLIGRRHTVMDGTGQNPLKSGKVYLRALNSQTALTSYKDSSLSVENTSPVRTDGSGKCEIWMNVDCDLRIETKDDAFVSEEFSVNPSDLSTTDRGGLVPNGSFELDADADDEPDGWTKTDEASSTNILDATKSTDGIQSMKFESAGSGGGNIITDDYFPVTETDDLHVTFDIESSVVDVRNIVRVEWFESDKTPISNSDIYDNAASNPTTWATQDLVQTPPALSRFAKLRLIGCDPSDATPGSTWFDNVSVFYPLTVSGTFDNIFISGNSIITTNVNGDLELQPNGTGAINFPNTTAVDLTDAANVMNIAVSTGQHIALDGSQIQSKSDATTASGLLLNALGGTVSVGLAASRADFLGTAVPALDDNTNALNVGAIAGIHIAVGGNDIQAKSDETTATGLDLNPLGGIVTLGAATGQANILSTLAPALDDNTNALNIGALAGAHLAQGPASIQAKASATTTAGLGLNTLGGVISMTNATGRVDIRSTTAPALDDNTNALNVGAIAGAHLAFGPAAIQGKASATTAANITLQALGGTATFSANAAVVGTTQQHDTDYNTAGMQVKDHGGTLRDIGYNLMPPVAFTASFTLDEGDVSKLHQKASGTTSTVTLPSGTSGAVFPVGAVCMIQNFDTEDILLDAAGTLYWFQGEGVPAAQASGQANVSAGGTISVYHFSDTVYHIWGNGITD
jgi:hypothetical protein